MKPRIVGAPQDRRIRGLHKRPAPVIEDLRGGPRPLFPGSGVVVTGVDVSIADAATQVQWLGEDWRPR